MRIKILMIALGFTLFSGIKVWALPSPGEGKNIFTARCIACHKIDKDFAGPALADIDKRQSIDWIIKFVHSPQAVIKSGDTSAVALFAKFKIMMPDHPDLTDDNIKSIVEYIKEESTKVASAAEVVPFAKPYQQQPNYTPISYKNIGFIIAFSIAIITLVLVLIFAVYVKQLERKMHEKHL
jgi:mono/diheme cytochrome c family protein